MTDQNPNDKALYPPVPAFSTALKGRCPRCGEGNLFAGVLSVSQSCANCRLSFDFEDSGDGPTVFVMLIVGLVVVGSAVYVEFVHQPPLWLHFVLWPPLLFGFGLWVLRVTKALLIVLQYQNNAHEGELATPPASKSPAVPNSSNDRDAD